MITLQKGGLYLKKKHSFNTVGAQLWFLKHDSTSSVTTPRCWVGGGGGEGGRVLTYMAYTGTCRWTGYDFWILCP